jgi:hypothetical protein
MTRVSILSRAYAEAEYILNIPNTYKHMMSSWGGRYASTKYAAKDAERFRISEVWTYLIIEMVPGIRTAC